MDKKLLKWGLANADPEALGQTQPPAFDPELINHILGHSEGEEMRRACQTISHPETTDEQRMEALEALEHFLQNLDNAGNMERMGLWPSVLGCLDSEHRGVLRMAWWVIGTAAQNHPPVQQALLKHGVLFRLLDHLSRPELELKHLRVLSALLQNHPEAIAAFTQAKGWQILEGKVSEGDRADYRGRLAFVLQAINHEQPLGELLAECPNLLNLLRN